MGSIIVKTAMEQTVAKSFVVGGIAESAMGRRIAAESARGEKRNEFTMGMGFAESAVERSEYSVKIFRGHHTLWSEGYMMNDVKHSAKSGSCEKAAVGNQYTMITTEETIVENNPVTLRDVVEENQLKDAVEKNPVEPLRC